MASATAGLGAVPDLGTATLNDGQTIGLRFATPADRGAILRGFEKLSPQSRYFRFFSRMNELPTSVVDRLADVDTVDRVAVVAYLFNDPTELIGVARYARLPETPTEADVALTVLDAHQELGVARAMYGACASIAIANGVETFTADVLSENRPMIRFFSRRGGQIGRDPRDASSILVRIPLV